MKLWLTTAAVFAMLVPTPLSAQRGLSESGVHEFVEEEMYDVSGSDFLEVFQDIEARGPVDSHGRQKHGLTSYELDPSWQLLQSRGRCRMGSVSVVARVKVKLPRWAAAKDSDADSQANWAKFINELRRHEYQHRDYVLDAAAELFEELTGLFEQLAGPGNGSCDRVRTEALTRTERAYDSLQRRQAALDGEEPNLNQGIGR